MVSAEGGDDSTFVDFQLETGNGGRDLNYIFLVFDLKTNP